MLKDERLLEEFDLVKKLDNQTAETINGGAYASLAAAMDGTWGKSWGYKTPEGAKDRALYECNKRFEGTDGCVAMWRGNLDCGAVAKSFNTLNSGRGATIYEAEQDALKKCGGDCSILTSVCA